MNSKNIQNLIKELEDEIEKLKKEISLISNIPGEISWSDMMKKINIKKDKIEKLKKEKNRLNSILNDNLNPEF